jgi:chromate transport protein ChrA
MRPPLVEIALLFLKLGAIGFGGPAAHIALMEAEVVRRRRWLSREEFLDLIGATNLIPGPNSTEMAIHIGYRRAGYPGLILAGVCFILPAAAIVTAIAWAYVRFGSLPELGAVLRAVKPIIIIVVLQAMWGLGKTAIKSPLMAAIAVGSVILNVAGVHELIVLLVAGACGALARTVQGSKALFSVELLPLFLFFLKVGSILCGPRGTVALAFRRATAGRRGCGPDHARARLHHGNLHRVRAGRRSRCRNRNLRHFSSGIRLCRSKWPACFQNPGIRGRRRRSGWSQRGVPGADERRDGATVSHRDHRCPYCLARPCGDPWDLCIPAEFRMARGGRSAGGDSYVLVAVASFCLETHPEGVKGS